MKIRNGFVSNSSSSSFIIDPKTTTIEKVEEYIEKLVEAHNILADNKITMSDICVVYKQRGEQFFEKILKYYNPSTYIIEKYNKCKNIECIVVDSTGDNSIPWEIQDALESISIMRQHWG